MEYKIKQLEIRDGIYMFILDIKNTDINVWIRRKEIDDKVFWTEWEEKKIIEKLLEEKIRDEVVPYFESIGEDITTEKEEEHRILTTDKEIKTIVSDTYLSTEL